MKKIFYSPYIRIIIGLIVVAAMSALGQIISNSLLGNVQINKIYKDVITGIFIAINYRVKIKLFWEICRHWIGYRLNSTVISNFCNFLLWRLYDPPR